MKRLVADLLLRQLARLAPPRPGPLPDLVPRRIAVLRYGGLGDVVVVTGFLASLRARYPAAEITCITTPAAAPLICHHPAVDRIVTTEDNKLSLDPLRSRRAYGRLKSLDRAGFDVLFMLHADLYRIALSPALKARYRVGFDLEGRGVGFPFSHPVVLALETAENAASRHLGELFHDLLRGFTGESTAAQPARLAITREEEASARAWCESHGIAQPPLVLLPCGSESIKFWPVARYVELARRIAERRRPVIVLGGQDERRLGSSFTGLPEGVIFAAGELPLRGSLALLSLSAATVGNDTGLLHAAAALGRPTLGLFGPTAWWAYGNRGPEDRVLHADLACIPCNRSTCALLSREQRDQTSPCLAALEVGDILESLDDLLAGRVRAAEPT